MTASPLPFALLLAAAVTLTPLSALAQEVAAPESGDGADSLPVTPEAVTAAEGPATAEDYAFAVISRIKSVAMNTSALREAGLTGEFETGVQFVTGSDGRLVSSAVTRSSGNPMVDNLAMAQIRAAEPFPLFAPDMGDEDRKYSINIKVNLDLPEVLEDTDGAADPTAPADAPADAPVEPPAE